MMIMIGEWGCPGEWAEALRTMVWLAACGWRCVRQNVKATCDDVYVPLFNNFCFLNVSVHKLCRCYER
jgi:hypothetical protein